MNNTLSKEELKDFTGFTHAHKQKEILAAHGIGFVVNGKGEIKTTWQAVNSALASEKTEDEEPSLDFLNG